MTDARDRPQPKKITSNPTRRNSARDRDADRRVCAAATEGPWHNEHRMIHSGTYGASDDVSIASVDSDPHARPGDAAFIAEARTALPWYIDALDAAERRVEELEAAKRCPHNSPSPSHAEGAWCNAGCGAFLALPSHTPSERTPHDAEPYLVDGRGRDYSETRQLLSPARLVAERDEAHAALASCIEALEAHHQVPDQHPQSTKQLCACGERYASRCELAMHLNEHYSAALVAARGVTEKGGQ